MNAFLLNPEEINAFAPKLELELLSAMSPPFSVTKCCAYPIAKTETNCKNESFVALIWKFSYEGLNLDLEFVLRLVSSVES